MVRRKQKSICMLLVLLLLGMLVVVMPAPAYAASSSFSLTGETYPTALSKGQSFGLTGTIKSTVTIDRVTVGVYNEDTGKWADGAVYREYDLGTKTYNIKTADPYVKFGKLSAGDYTYRVWVKDTNGTSKYLLKKAFTVKSTSSSSSGTSSFSISGANYPTSLTKGKSFSIYGTVKSNLKINRVTVGVYNEDKGAWVDTAVHRVYNLGAKTYDISKADAYIKFGTLSAGNYTYRVWVKDVNGKSKYVLKKAFTVKSTSSSSSSTSSFSISGANYPTSLTKGKSFSISGTVKSNLKINRVTVGVYNEDKGAWVDTAVHRVYNLGAKTYDISKADAYIKFGTLSAGNYTYRVWVKDVNGKSKYVLKKAFTVKSSSSDSSSSAESSFSVSGANYPTTLAKGKSFSIKGTVKSNLKINRVTVGVYNEDKGEWVSTAVHRVYNLGAKTYDISKADAYIKFGTLNDGNYTYRVWVKDVNGKSKYVLKKSFKVGSGSASSSFSISGANYPTALTRGQSFSIKGTIKSTLKIDRVTVGVYNEDRDEWVDGAVVRKYSLGSTSYDISKADDGVAFGSLGNGNYTYRVWVKDVKGVSKYLLKKPFTVTTESKSSAPVAVLLSYDSALIKKIGKQPYSGPCGIYSMAYARAVIDGSFPLGKYDSYQDKILSEYGHGSSYAYWSEAGGSMIMFSTVSSLYRKAFDQLADGMPCIMNCYNPQTGNNHFVTVIGYVKGTTRSNVSLDSFIILDPATGTKRNMEDTGYESPANSPYGPELIVF